jgi:hypothetical protein
LQDTDTGLRKQYLRLFIDCVEVRDDQILISGPKTALANAIVRTSRPNSEEVPSYVAEWWWTQSWANPSPAISLICRENTGNFSKLDRE